MHEEYSKDKYMKLLQKEIRHLNMRVEKVESNKVDSVAWNKGGSVPCSCTKNQKVHSGPSKDKNQKGYPFFNCFFLPVFYVIITFLKCLFSPYHPFSVYFFFSILLHFFNIFNIFFLILPLTFIIFLLFFFNMLIHHNFTNVSFLTFYLFSYKSHHFYHLIIFSPHPLHYHAYTTSVSTQCISTIIHIYLITNIIRTLHLPVLYVFLLLCLSRHNTGTLSLLLLYVLLLLWNHQTLCWLHSIASWIKFK